MRVRISVAVERKNLCCGWEKGFIFRFVFAMGRLSPYFFIIIIPIYLPLLSISFLLNTTILLPETIFLFIIFALFFSVLPRCIIFSSLSHLGISLITSEITEFPCDIPPRKFFPKSPSHLKQLKIHPPKIYKYTFETATYNGMPLHFRN